MKEEYTIPELLRPPGVPRAPIALHSPQTPSPAPPVRAQWQKNLRNVLCGHPHCRRYRPFFQSID